MPAAIAAAQGKRQIRWRPLWVVVVVAAVSLALLAWTTPPAWSHPHVFIEVRLEVVLNEQGIEGIWQHWTFDEYFSLWIIEDFDTDGDGRFSAQELAVVYAESFQFVANYGYFTRVRVGTREIPVRRIEHFSAVIADNRTIYSFFVPLNIAVDSDTPPVTIAVYDESFYCHVLFPKGEVRFKGDVRRWQVQHTTRKLPELSYYFGFMTPTAVQLDLSAP